MASLPCLLLFISALLCSFHPSIARLVAPNKETELVDKVCKQTKDYPFCTKSLDSDPRTPTADLPTLGHVAVDVALTHGKVTFGYMSELLGNLSFDDPMSIKLSRCKDRYVTTIGLLIDAGKYIDGKKYKALLSVLTDYETYPAVCEEEFKKPPARKSPLTNLNNDMTKLYKIVEVITGLLGA